jgi:DNA polymerase-3 subunit chi
MPQVEFHSGLAEPLRYACRLLRKAWRQGVRVAVTAPGPVLQALDRELWTFEAHEFVPHKRIGGVHGDETAEDVVRRLTPIWLCDGDVPAGGPKILVNLGATAPADAERFERIIELVSQEAQERRDARARWRDYEARGWPIQHHDRSVAT